MSRAAPTVARKAQTTLDLVRLRDVLEELASREEKEPLLELVTGLLEQCQTTIEALTYEVAVLKKQLYGRQSEKVSPDQLHLFAGVLEAMVQKEAETTEDAEGTEKTAPETASRAAKKRGGKRKRRPLRPTQTVTLPVPDAERPCPTCGRERCTIGHDRSLVVEYTPPRIDVIEYLREKLACKGCEGEVVRAPGPEERVVEGALPGPRLLAQLAVQKLVDGLPLHRTRRILARHGADLPVSTLNRWEGFGHELVAPVAERLRQVLLDSDVINLDDTGLRIRDPATRGGTWRGHVWVFVGSRYDPGGDLEKTEVVVTYLYAPTWEAKHVEEFLRDCRAILQGDAYKGYGRISEPRKGEVKNLLAGCMMHARRPFAWAFETGDPSAPFFVERFQEIYRIERLAREQKLRADQRLELRQSRSRPVLEVLRERAHELDPLPLTKPMRQGVRYLINQWPRLLVPFEKDGRLEIDNGEAERRLRRVASGRKAWLFAGSHRGARRLADMLSLVSSAEAAGVEPGVYLADVFAKLAGHWPQRRLDDLLPLRWRHLDHGPQ